MAQGQVLGDTLAVVRDVDRNAEILTFTIGMFKITATKNGVTFAGSSVTFGSRTMVHVLKYIHYANMAHQQLAANLGMPLQRELERGLKIKTKERPSGGWDAWFQGHRATGVIGDTQADAVAKLRAFWRTQEHGGITVKL